MSETAKHDSQYAHHHGPQLVKLIAPLKLSPPSIRPPPLSQPTDNGSLLVDPTVGFDSVTAYSVDGTGNNQTNPDLGAAGTDETRAGAGQLRARHDQHTGRTDPNPRDISNAIFANDQNANDPGGRSAYMYAFGQFIDHDIDLNNGPDHRG